MVVFYRVCPFLSSNPSPVFSNDKEKLMKLCFTSFIKGFRDLRPKVVFICDSCPKEWIADFERFPWEHEVITEERVGNFGTYLMQLELARKVDGHVLLQEDDYFYQEGVGTKVDKALDQLEFLSPYDHPDHYFNPLISEGSWELKLIDGQHWRTTCSNTLTFASTGIFIDRSFDILSGYGIADHPMWLKMREEGHKIWTPIPSLSTHMVRDYIAPSISWDFSC